MYVSAPDRQGVAACRPRMPRRVGRPRQVAPPDRARLAARSRSMQLEIDAPREVSVDAKSTFIKRFGDLVALLRADPGNDAAQDLALAAAAAAVETGPLEVEAGIEWSVIPDDLTLKGRLLARHVEAIRIAAGTEPDELLALARALSHDAVPVRSSPNIQVEMVEFPAPPPDRDSPRRSSGRAVRARPPPRDRASELVRAPTPGAPAVPRDRAPADRGPAGQRRAARRADRGPADGVGALARAAGTKHPEPGLGRGAHRGPRARPAGAEGPGRPSGARSASSCRRAIPRRAIEALVDEAERESEQRRAGFRGAALDRARRGGGRARSAARRRGAGCPGLLL